MNILSLIKAVPIVISFLIGQKAQIQKLVLDAEQRFPGLDNGLNKLAHVVGGVFAIIQDAGGAIANVPADVLTAILTGHISQVVAKIVPPAQAPQAT